MNTKFDQLIEEMSKSEGTNPSEVIKNISQDLTKCSSNLDNLAYRFYQRTSQEALAIRGAMMKVDEARRILSSLQD